MLAAVVGDLIQTQQPERVDLVAVDPVELLQILVDLLEQRTLAVAVAAVEIQLYLHRAGLVVLV
jgi:hypothetical protein